MVSCPSSMSVSSCSLAMLAEELRPEATGVVAMMASFLESDVDIAAAAAGAPGQQVRPGAAAGPSGAAGHLVRVGHRCRPGRPPAGARTHASCPRGGEISRARSVRCVGALIPFGRVLTPPLLLRSGCDLGRGTELVGDR